ncbi:MAG: glycoside hydrolase family 3 protein [Firmicutes bacterium]|nr:glycoside hydrolase family 3 protein [Bacillota bacterium]
MELTEYPFLDPALDFNTRVNDLVDRMTLEEKVSQTVHSAAAIPRLGIPSYNWWNECLHGVGRAGIATVFPQAIGLAAAWNEHLLHEVAAAVADEARAKHHEFVRQGIRDIYTGLTMWSPNINVFRDPRWGRGQETYGEDPYLTSRLAVAFIKGLQGDDPKYLKVVATPKHFAVHSGPEAERHSFDAKVNNKDLWETYLPAFEAAIKAGKARSVMGAYNRTNGEPCCASKTLLEDILRGKWGFDGYIVSDCWAISDFYKFHKIVETPLEAAALAMNNGCDLCCGTLYALLIDAVKEDLVKERTLDKAVKRLFKARMELGMFDPEETVSYSQIPYAVNDSDTHRKLALEAARESIVLLKNDGILPISKEVNSVAVIGPNIDNLDALLGNYNGTPSRYTTPLYGIKEKVSPETIVYHTQGCDLRGDSQEGFAAAVEIAGKSDVAILCLGLSPRIEGEEGDGGDLGDITLLGVQEQLMQAVYATGTPTIVVLMSGTAIAVNWAKEHVSAILAAWYPGEEGGRAAADVLFGDYNPAGRLPITFYKSVDDLPDFEDYSMVNRTYRYFQGTPLYPFGHGLSYTDFAYSDLNITSGSIQAGESIQVEVTVENTGTLAGDEVIQLYLKDAKAHASVPIHALKGFHRVHLKPKKRQRVCFTLTAFDMAVVMETGTRVVEPGLFEVIVGGRQPAGMGENADLQNLVKGGFRVEGKAVEVEFMFAQPPTSC